MNPEAAVMTNSVVGGAGSLKSRRLSYRVYGSHGLREVLNGYVLGSALGALVWVFFHGLKFFANYQDHGHLPAKGDDE